MSSQAAPSHQSDTQSRRRAAQPIARGLFIALIFAGGILVGVYHRHLYAAVAPMFGINASADTLDTTLLQQTYQELVANYDGDLDRNALIEGAARGMTDAAGDEYTTFFSADEADRFNEGMSGSIGGGIGAQVGTRDDSITLVRILSGTPAERAGLKAGDRVLAINDETTEKDTVDSAVDKIRGEIGTTVKLRIQRDSDIKDVTITREEVSAPSVMYEVKDTIGIITMTRFDEQTAQLTRQAATKFKEANVKGIVLDLRGNPGGYLTAARDVASVWLPRGTLIVTEKQGDTVTDQLHSRQDPLLQGVPTVVLIDGNSASASEIVAGALQDHGAATLLGETTFGKGSVQRLVPLDGGRLLKVTVARWFTPNGKNITKEGIAPDQKVAMTAEQLRAGDDVQLSAALQRLQ